MESRKKSIRRENQWILNTAMRRVAQGNFTERVLIEGTGEFSELALSFNTMAAQLEADTNLRRYLFNNPGRS